MEPTETSNSISLCRENMAETQWDFFSTVKENEVMLFRKMYVNGDKSKSSQPQTYTVCFISFVVPSLI